MCISLGGGGGGKGGGGGWNAIRYQILDPPKKINMRYQTPQKHQISDMTRSQKIKYLA